MEKKKRYQRTALMAASRKGKIEIVRELVERGANINAYNFDKKRRDKEEQQ